MGGWIAAGARLDGAKRATRSIRFDRAPGEDFMPIRGSCHCGKVAFTLDGEPGTAMACNCSICRRKGYLLAFATPERFHLETPREDIAVYTFGAPHIRHPTTGNASSRERVCH